MNFTTSKLYVLKIRCSVSVCFGVELLVDLGKIACLGEGYGWRPNCQWLPRIQGGRGYIKKILSICTWVLGVLYQYQDTFPSNKSSLVWAEIIGSLADVYYIWLYLNNTVYAVQQHFGFTPWIRLPVRFWYDSSVSFKV